MTARVLPPASELRRMRDSGMTNREIAEKVYQETGYRPAPSSVSARLSREGQRPAVRPPRYREEIPWRVSGDHQTHYAARMLRLLGRRRAGEVLTGVEAQRIESWLAKLEESGAVVVYLPETDEGFHYITGPWDAPDLPIRRDARAH